MLAAEVREGTGRAAHASIRAAGKTGTASGNREALFVGFTGRLVTGM